MQSWYVEGYFKHDGLIHRQPIKDSPFIMGREENLPLTISAHAISRRHAQIEIDGAAMTISDLGSKNGTYVNHRKIDGPTAVRHGDIIHLGDMEMRLMKEHAELQSAGGDSTIIMSVDDLSHRFPYGAKELEQILDSEAITTAFQPIVFHDNSGNYGWEVLGRGTSALLPKSPGALFQVAESVGMEIRLSELMRNKGVAIGAQLGLKGPLFINTHPSELRDPDVLLQSIHALRKRHPDTEILLEIHEQAITDIQQIKMIKKELEKMSILIGYDDFGVGQSRLLELVEAKPDVLKFDLMLTQDIHRAEPAKLELVKQLQSLSSKLRIKTLAECVSRQEDYEVCKTIGFDYYQGYLFSEPKFPSELQAG